MVFDPSKFGATLITQNQPLNKATPTFDPTKFGATAIEEIPTKNLNATPESDATFPITGNENKFTAPLKALGNMPKSAFNLAKSIITAPITAVKNAAEIGKEVGTHAGETGESPASTFFNSLKETPHSAYEVLTPQFIKHIIDGVGKGDALGGVQNSLKSIVEDPVGQIAPMVLLARGAAEQMGKGAEFDAMVKKTTSPVTEGVPNTVKSIMPKGTPASEAFQRVTGQVFQPKNSFETNVAQKVAANIDFGELPRKATYDDLSNLIQKNIEQKLTAVDEKLGGYQETFKPADITKSVVSEGGKTAKINYVQESITDLKNLYKAVKDPQSLVDVKDLETKLKSEGLTSKEINDLARQYGTEFGKKAFSKTGDPLTSTNAQAFESIRKGLKENARGTLPDDEAKALDKNASSLIRAKDMVDRINQKVSMLENKVKQRNIMEKVGRFTGTAIDVATFGGLKAFITKLFFPSNVGLKTMNSLDLEAELGKNLKIIDKLANAPDHVVANTIKTMLQKINNSPDELHSMIDGLLGAKSSVK